MFTVAVVTEKLVGYWTLTVIVLMSFYYLNNKEISCTEI